MSTDSVYLNKKGLFKLMIHSLKQTFLLGIVNANSDQTACICTASCDTMTRVVGKPQLRSLMLTITRYLH